LFVVGQLTLTGTDIEFLDPGCVGVREIERQYAFSGSFHALEGRIPAGERRRGAWSEM
jgi:hypothetical protein